MSTSMTHPIATSGWFFYAYQLSKTNTVLDCAKRTILFE